MLTKSSQSLSPMKMNGALSRGGGDAARVSASEVSTRCSSIGAKAYACAASRGKRAFELASGGLAMTSD